MTSSNMKMNELNLKCASKLTEEERIAYYKWLLSNADRLEEIRDMKRAQRDAMLKLKAEKDKKIQENAEYLQTLNKRVIEKRAEREVLTKMVKKMQEVSLEFQEELKQLDPEVEQITKHCQEADGLMQVSHRKLAKCYQEVDVLKQDMKAEVNDHMFELNAAKDELDQRSQSHDVTKDQLAKKQQELEEETKEKEKNMALLEDYNPDELKAKLAELKAEQAQRQDHLDTKKSNLQKDHEEVNFIREKCGEMEQMIANAKDTQIQAVERNKVKMKEIDNAVMLLRVQTSKKLAEETNKVDEENIANVNVLNGLMKQNEALEAKYNALNNEAHDIKKDVETSELEKRETEGRLANIKSNIANSASSIKNLPNIYKDKIDAANTKVKEVQKEIADAKASYAEKIRNLTGNQSILANFMNQMEKLKTADNEEEEDTSDKDTFNDTFNSTGNLADTSARFQPKLPEAFIGKNIEEIIEMLDPVKSNEALNKSKTKIKLPK